MYFRDSADSGNPLPPAVMEIRPKETYCPWNWPCAILSKDIARPKKLVQIQNEQARTACLPEDSRIVNDWISHEPWGRVNALTRQGLGDGQIRPFLLRLKAAGFTAVQFVEEMIRQDVTILADRTNITGLLISLIRRMPAPPIPRENEQGDRSPSRGGNGQPPPSDPEPRD